MSNLRLYDWWGLKFQSVNFICHHFCFVLLFSGVNASCRHKQYSKSLAVDSVREQLTAIAFYIAGQNPKLLNLVFSSRRLHIELISSFGPWLRKIIYAHSFIFWTFLFGVMQTQFPKTNISMLNKKRCIRIPFLWCLM